MMIVYLVDWNSQLEIEPSLSSTFNADCVHFLTFNGNVMQGMRATGICVCIRKGDLFREEKKYEIIQSQ